MPVKVTLRDGYRTTNTVRDHTWHADEPLDKGGANSAPTPGELMLSALGSCIAITMKLYADKKGWDLQGVDVAVDYERFNGKGYPAYEGDSAFGHGVRKSLTLHGNLDEDQRERLYDIATKCPIHRLLATPTFFADLEEELLAD